MSVSSVSVAAVRDKREDMVGVGNTEKSLVHSSFKLSSITKPGKVVGEYGVGSRGGDQKIDIAA